MAIPGGTSFKIPLFKTEVTEADQEMVDLCLRKQWLTYRTPIVKEFEAALAEHIGPTISCSSGTAAIYLALLALNVRGGEVIVPALGFGTVVSAIIHAGAKPVYVDADEFGFCDTLPITEKTKAVIVINLYGEMPLALRDCPVPIIQDACESFGELTDYATFTCYSFYANKDVTCGEGGAISGKDLTLVRKLRDGGFDSEYRFEVPGLNFRMTAMQAALGYSKLGRVYDVYRQHLRARSLYGNIGFGYWLYVVEVDDPKKVIDALAAEGIESRRVFPLFHEQPAFKEEGNYPNAKYLYEHGVCLPTHVNKNEADEILKIIWPYLLTQNCKPQSVTG